MEPLAGYAYRSLEFIQTHEYYHHSYFSLVIYNIRPYTELAVAGEPYCCCQLHRSPNIFVQFDPSRIPIVCSVEFLTTLPEITEHIYACRMKQYRTRFIIMRYTYAWLNLRYSEYMFVYYTIQCVYGIVLLHIL